MATKSAQPEPVKAEVIEEALDALDTTLDRVKVLYEQYFLGIQKQPPTYLHTDIERKLRDIAQLQIRNTALRYRFVTLQQKFGSYNSYWRRTLRQIENGTYTRNLFKIGRQAARTGADLPPEILAAMPKRMRDQVMRDREAALALARLREKHPTDDLELLTLADEDVDIDVEDLDLDSAVIEESSELRRDALAGGAYKIDESDADFDLDAFFAAVTNEDGPDIELRKRSTGGIPVVGRAPTLRSDPRPPADTQPGGHPRPGSLSGSPIAALSDDLRVPGGRTRRSSRAGAGRRSTGQIRADRGAAPPQAAAAATATATAPGNDAEPVTEVSGPPRRSGKSRPPAKHGATQALPRVARAPAAAPPTTPAAAPPASPAATTPAAAPPTSQGPPPAPPPRQATRAMPAIAQTPPQATRAIPSAAPTPPEATRAIPSAAPTPPQATRAIPSAAPTPPEATRVMPSAAPTPPQALRSVPSGAPTPPQATRSIPVSPPTPPPQATRSIPSVRGAAAPSQATRSIPVAPGPAVARSTPAAGSTEVFSPANAATPAGSEAAAPSQATRSIPVAPGSSAPSQATRSIPVPGSSAPSQATRSIPVVPGSSTAQTPVPVESMAGPFPRIPSIPSLPSTPAGPKPGAAPLRPASAKERGAVPRIIAPERSEPIDAETDEPTDVMSAAVPERMPERPAPAARLPDRHPPARPTGPGAAAGAPQRPTPPPRDRPIPPSARREPDPPQAPPPGMSNADVNALYAKYVKAKEILGEEAGPGAYGKLLKTINAQAPKIMEQYNAKGVDFSVVVKDNQVIIRAKPKP